jgi:hypothetical protein
MWKMCLIIQLKIPHINNLWKNNFIVCFVWLWNVSIFPGQIKVQVYENKVFSKIDDSRRDDICRKWRIVYNKELEVLYTASLKLSG